jgi:S1-C subfamily serine protease
LTRHNIAHAFGFSTPDLTQNNFRASVGVVYLFGRVQESSPQAQRGSTGNQQCAGSSEAALLGVVGCDTSGGFKVASVKAGSPAALCGLRPGDIVMSIDGRAIHSSHDIETAIAANTSGTIKVGYMIQGNDLTERDTKVR